MSQHQATIRWHRSGTDFLKGKYSREHTWSFDGGVVLTASAAPANVPLPFSNPAGVDPEEAFVAAISSCHMLTYLFVAYQHGFLVESYEDQAVGVMSKNQDGVEWVSSVTLHPKVIFGGDRLPTAEEEQHLHHLAHEQCFIANSVKSEIKVHRA